MLKELDAEHERIVIDIQAGEQNSPEYRAINPMGKVPTLVDGDAVITEAAAICAYLADKFAEKGFALPDHQSAAGTIGISSSQVPPLNRFSRSPRLGSRISSRTRWGGVICRALWPQSSR